MLFSRMTSCWLAFSRYDTSQAWITSLQKVSDEAGVITDPP